VVAQFASFFAIVSDIKRWDPLSTIRDATRKIQSNSLFRPEWNLIPNEVTNGSYDQCVQELKNRAESIHRQMVSELERRRPEFEPECLDLTRRANDLCSARWADRRDRFSEIESITKRSTELIDQWLPIYRQFNVNTTCLDDLSESVNSLNAGPMVAFRGQWSNGNVRTIVIDNGSSLSKAGFAGAEQPSAVFQSIVGLRRLERVADLALYDRIRDRYVGDQIRAMPRALYLKYPITREIVGNWEELEMIWQHTFDDQLRVDPSEYSVLLTKTPRTSKADQERMIEFQFEKFNVRSFYVESQAVLSLYTSCRTTGIVLDIGDGFGYAVPIYEGSRMPHAIKHLALAGRNLTDWLHKMLADRGYTFTTFAEHEIVRDIKEKLAYVALDFESEQPKSVTTTDCNVNYTLPDGNEIVIGNERFRCPELLFKPHLNGFEHRGIHQTLVDSVMECHFDVQKDLYANIVLSGGTTLFPGFATRLEKEVTRSVRTAMKIRVIAPHERKYASWIGGSILASLTTFPQMAITREEYNDAGPTIVNHKCC
jgi:actin